MVIPQTGSTTSVVETDGSAAGPIPHQYRCPTRYAFAPAGVISYRAWSGFPMSDSRVVGVLQLRWPFRLLGIARRPRGTSASGVTTGQPADEPGGRMISWRRSHSSRHDPESAKRRRTRRRTAAGRHGKHARFLAQAKAGNQGAIELLLQRCLPPLRRWARGRLPSYARDLAETQDLVQEAALRTLHNLANFEAHHQGALQAYLRQAVANRIRDEIDAPRVIRHRSSSPRRTPTRRRHRSSRPSAVKAFSATTKRSRGCVTPTARRSWRASSCSKATKRSPSRSASRRRTRRASR